MVRWYLGEWRERRGMTQTEVADAMGTSVSMVSDHENRKRRMNDDWIAKWAELMRVDPVALLSPPPAGGVTVEPSPDQARAEAVQKQFLALAESDQRMIVDLMERLPKLP